MEKTNLLLVGGGGHCHSVIESIERNREFDILGISDVPSQHGKIIAGYKVIVSDEEIPSLAVDTFSCLVTVGQIKTPEPRIKIYNFLKSKNLKIATVIDPLAVVSKRSVVGEGTVILNNCIVNTGVVIGVNSIINTGSIIEHDSKIGNHVHISTGVIINGDCEIGDGCFIGSGAVISNGITIHPGALIGAGSIVLSHITNPGTYLGNPARRIK